VVGFGVVVDPLFDAVLFVGVAVPVEVADPAPLPEAGVAAGAEAGNDVSRVGSAGRGFDKIPASISGRPVSDLKRNL
jgi:hypothetical protein